MPHIHLAAGLRRLPVRLHRGTAAAGWRTAGCDGRPGAHGGCSCPTTTRATATRGVIGRGFAQVSGQPGKTLGERRLLAVRAARLDALRDLAEQVRGVRLDVETVVDDAVVRDDRLSAELDTTLRGARTVSIQPRGDDGYEVVMELDAASVALVLRMARAGA